MFLNTAHTIWGQHIQPGDKAIDATCGNGYDSHVLRQLPLSHLFIIDIQKTALCRTKQRLGNNERTSYLLQCHSSFSNISGPIHLIVYNLGYLPGSDHSITTSTSTTLTSLQSGISLLSKNGLISCMLYPGHEEGSREALAVLGFAKTLSAEAFEVRHYQHLNRIRSPSLLLIKKKFTN